MSDEPKGPAKKPPEKSFVGKDHDAIMAKLEKDGGSRESAQAAFADQDAVLDASSGDRERRTDPRGHRPVDSMGRVSSRRSFGWGAVCGLAAGALIAGLFLQTGALSWGARTDAAAIRSKAYRACALAQWEECTGLFDEAKARDPQGDGDPGVRSARAAAARALHP